MDYDNTGGTVSGGCVDCGHNHCDFDVILSHNFEERYVYKFAYTHAHYFKIILARLCIMQRFIHVNFIHPVCI